MLIRITRALAFLRARDEPGTGRNKVKQPTNLIEKRKLEMVTKAQKENKKMNGADEWR